MRNKINLLKIKYFIYISKYNILYKKVYYIPKLGVNLLSISRLENKEIIFRGNKVTINNTINSSTIATGYKKNNLYYLDG